MQMLAVSEAAMAQVGAKFYKPLQQIVMADMRQPKLADTRRVDQVAAVREVKPLGRRGGMGALADGFRQGANPQVDAREPGVDQR